MDVLSINRTLLKGVLVVFTLGWTTLGNAQKATIESHYENYASINQEAIYVHLNKSTFIVGEDLGFTAYAFDKKQKRLSEFTTNLYISVEDENQKPVKQMLLHVVDGVASNAIAIDSSFSSGKYIFKAYTSWSLNFNEQDIYTESIEVLDPDEQEYVETSLIETQPDAQFLPEGGHLLSGTINKVGVVIKDHMGYGIPYAKGKVLDNAGKTLTTFEVNRMGIGQFSLLPSAGVTYSIEINCLNDSFKYDLEEPVESRGMILSLNQVRKKLVANISTNSESLKSLGNETFYMAIHNGDDIQLIDFKFGSKLSISKGFDMQNMPTGVNVFTIFNAQNQPIIERLFFNYHGLQITNSTDYSTNKERDSIGLTINYNNIKENFFNHVSVSVLPENTQTYNRHHNIVSSVFLKPYLRGTIERADYYFSDITPEKQLELDNLLLTQGWSSFNWKEIFKDDHLFLHEFEQGLSIKGNVNASISKGDRTYLLHSVSGGDPLFFQVPQNEISFQAENIFPVGTKRVYFSEVTQTGNKPSSLFLQVFPNQVPQSTLNEAVLGPKPLYELKQTLRENDMRLDKPEDLQELKEIVITGRIERNRTRLKQLQKGKFGNVKVIDDIAIVTFNTLAEYLRYYGLFVDETDGGFRVFNGYSYGLRGTNATNNNMVATSAFDADSPGNNDPGQPINWSDNDKIMAIFLDGAPLPDASLLHQFPLLYIDYVEINRRGFGEGFRGAAGVIKVYSNWSSSIGSIYDNSAQGYKLPLSFEKEKRFYVPKYGNERDAFFQEYGVIDWKPSVRIENNSLNFNIKKTKVPMKLFIEGYLGDGTFISEVKEVKVN